MSTTTYSLQLNFKDNNNDKLVFSYPHAKSTASASDVKALMQGMITNNSIWQKNPNTISSAKLISRTVSEFDLS